jgi:CheY-like chemotaxis protein
MTCVLIVDDNRTIRVLLKNFFLSAPNQFSVHEAVDGLDALEKASIIGPDLIVLDVSMPKLNGLEAARRMREMKITSPIVFFSHHDLPESERKSAGLHVVVRKPDLTELHRQVQYLLSTRQRRSEN